MFLVDPFLRKSQDVARGLGFLATFLRHGTPRKFANLLRAETERRLRRVTLASRPCLAIIDPSNVCGLHCAFCPTGRRCQGRPERLMTLAGFKHCFDPLAPYLFGVRLHNWGDPLLNRQVFDMIAHAAASNVGTTLNANLLSAVNGDLNGLLECGLERLVVSFEGVSQETYAQRRLRGDYQAVINNLRELVRRRRLRGLKRPVIEWEYVLFKHAAPYASQAVRLAGEFGVDRIRFIADDSPFQFHNRRDIVDLEPSTWGEWRAGGARRDPPIHHKKRPGPCCHLYRTMVINSDGGVSPCCAVHRKSRDFAQFEGRPFDVLEVWNNDRYRSARAQFSLLEPPALKPTVCDGCGLFSKPPGKILPFAPGFSAEHDDAAQTENEDALQAGARQA